MIVELKDNLNPIGSTPSLQDLAYTAIRASILSLALPPGMQLSESGLAERLKVSKTPVREALQRLEREGLVRIAPRKGVFVTEISITEIEEITEIRSVLIGLSARRAARTATEADIQEARQILASGEASMQSADYEEWLKVNDRFHAWLLRIAHNTSLSQIMIRMDERFERVQRLAANAPMDIIESNIGHFAILSAIAAHNPDAAASAASEHILQIGHQAVSIYQDMQEKG